MGVRTTSDNLFHNVLQFIVNPLSEEKPGLPIDNLFEQFAYMYIQTQTLLVIEYNIEYAQLQIILNPKANIEVIQSWCVYLTPHNRNQYINAL